MQIHVVKPGESLNSIAQLYNTTTNMIATSNEIPPPYQLVVGQALVIPIVGSYYTVQPGDSLYRVSQRYGINYQELARINGLSPNTQLSVGQRLYIPPRPKQRAEINAYVEPLTETVSPALEQAATKAAPYLTYLAPFSYRILRDGSLEAPPLNNFGTIARNNRATLMMVVTNLEEGAFSAELGQLILENKELQNKLIDNIIRTAKSENFSDIHFDMEFLRPVDRENYIAFLTLAKERLSQNGLLMSVALAPKTSAEQVGPWYEAHDYGAIGEIADFVVLMTYEWGYSGGPPLPVSPLPNVREVVEYALTEMPASKIMLGQNLYGYDWTLPFVQGGEFAKAISPQRAIEIARTYNVPIQYDEKNQAPFIEYTDENGKEHIIWFEDARSIQAKFDLVKELKLRGVSYWKLGLAFPQNWLLIVDNFNVVKQQ
ncbi:MAG: glycoside hydrolase family 18 [Haloplasmataceae bacterium]|jgi:spore germination protein|nr:glycoside hydrolase family 18 [Haloplasmataceae bacterium]